MWCGSHKVLLRTTPSCCSMKEQQRVLLSPRRLPAEKRRFPGQLLPYIYSRSRRPILSLRTKTPWGSLISKQSLKFSYLCSLGFKTGYHPPQILGGVVDGITSTLSTAQKNFKIFYFDLLTNYYLQNFLKNKNYLLTPDYTKKFFIKFLGL